MISLSSNICEHNEEITTHPWYTWNPYIFTDALSLPKPQAMFSPSINYHPRMRVGKVFGHVCLCVCLCVCVCLSLCVCLSVFLSVQAITFESLDIETSFLVCRYILTISRSSLSIKVIGLRSRSYEKIL